MLGIADQLVPKGPSSIISNDTRAAYDALLTVPHTLPPPPKGMNSTNWKQYSHQEHLSYFAQQDPNWGKQIGDLYSGRYAKSVAVGGARDPYVVYGLMNIFDWLFSRGRYAKNPK